jgi:hypothetical protein
MYCSDGNWTRLAYCAKHMRDQICSGMGLGLILRFFQIQARAEGRAGTTQNKNTFPCLVRGKFDRSYQLGQQLD